ncbi:MAG: winged helix-turn-helix domain-containing protein [Vicinamibacteria bacterium]|nr:winged helix-turn-helix domain-containing protein [Vicinamibacteria bacterium]
MPHPTYRFGRFLFDRTGYRLFDQDRAIGLAPKVLDLLGLLVARPSELVTKEDILREVWFNVAVTDNAVTQAVSDLRQALGDDPVSPQYIQTVPRRGYRFIARVAVAPHASERSTSAVHHESLPRGAKRAVAVADFANVTADADVSWMAAGIAETVTNDLRALRDLRIIDRSTLPDAVRRSSVESARASGLDLLVVGSYQRAGDGLRITARAIDAATGEAVAHAKADGPLADVFRLQDTIVTQLLAGLQVPVTVAAAARIGVRETSSLDAYRALTEGRLKLETLDAADVPAAIGDFERALALDPRYALAYVGLAHAHFWRYETSRWRNRPDAVALAAAIGHARRAIELDAGLGEAHAALAFFLASAGRCAEARDAGRAAVALEPNDWRHRFRLGVAAWGEERLACFDEVAAVYPAFAYAYFGAAMVHVARHDLQAAEDVLMQGIAAEGRGVSRPHRFPANGLHWLLGLVRLSHGAIDGAEAQFGLELTSAGRELYAAEFAMDAYDGLGFARLAARDCSGAASMFGKALAISPDHARSLVGLAAACGQLGNQSGASDAMAHAARSVGELRESGRATEAAVAHSMWQVGSGQTEEASHTLLGLMDEATPGFAGWTIPVEPLLDPIRRLPAYQRVLERLAQRAV